MNENIDLTKILKNCPKGFEFYSSIHGKLFYDGMYIDSSASKIYFKSSNIRSIVDGNPIPIIYLWNGKLYYEEGECTIFPSKEQRDWSKFSAPWYKKEKFDPKTLKAFDRVLTRIDGGDVYCWFADFVSAPTIEKYDLLPSVMSNKDANMIIPYNDETKHLIGTKDEAPEYYRYWEN